VHLTILKKGLLLIAVPLLFQLVFIAVLLRVINDAAESERLALHTKNVLVQSEMAYGHMVAAQSAARGFVISGDSSFGDTSARAVDSAMEGFSSLPQLVQDDPQRRDRARRVLAAAEVMADFIRRLNTSLRLSAADTPVAQLGTLEGRRRLNALRAEIDTFVAFELDLEQVRLNELAQSRAAQRWVIGGGTLGATLVTCFAAYLFSRSVSHRLRVVTANAEALARGQPLAARLRGRDEIARLDAVMHETATRLAQAAEDERRLTAELEKRAAALSVANESLRQQTQENEMFVYSVSHDLRSPLVNLQGFSRELSHAGEDLRELLADDRIPADIRNRVDQLLTNDVVDSIRFIQSAVLRSAAIIDALLRLSRAGRIEYRRQQVDVLAIVRRVVDAMTNSIEARKAQVKVPLVLPSCWGDPTAIEQVFGNLIGNAVNYLDPARPGLVQIGVANESPVLREGMHTYYVRDNGLGIPAAYLGKVFVAFQRLHGEVAKGEGIGLALVRRMVERHGGEVWVESTEGVGTTFYLALPATDPDIGAAEESESSGVDLRVAAAT